MLHTVLPLAFWEGSLIVCAGSALCWLATRRQPVAPVQAELRPLSCTGVEE